MYYLNFKFLIKIDEYLEKILLIFLIVGHLGNAMG